MKKRIFIFVMIFSLLMMSDVFGNAAEPPSLVIYVKQASEDLELYLLDGNEKYQMTKYDKFGGVYYKLYEGDLNNRTDYQLGVESASKKYAVKFSENLKMYHNIYTLNYEKGTLKKGKDFLRSLILISLRVSVTLVLEGFVYALFRFEENRSWLIFLFINLLTQSWLNIWINALSPGTSYLFISLIFYEFFIVAAELVLFNIFVKEHPKWYISLYVVTGNLVSLIIGGYIIVKLPI